MKLHSRLGCIALLLCSATLLQGLQSATSRQLPPPLTPKERWQRYLHENYTSPPIYYASVGAAWGDQASNAPRQWRRTTSGYAKRVGTTYATFALQNTIYESGSAALGNEPRYVACQCSGGWHRAGYALRMSFFTYHGAHTVFDFPQFAGAYGGGMIPLLWYPRGYSPLVQGVQNGHQQLGLVVVVREIQEFSPELKRFFRRLKP